MEPEQQQRIMGYFIEETQEHLNTLDQGLENLAFTLQNPEMVNEAFRAAHSVKGGAAMLGINSVEKTAHQLENCFHILKESTVNVDPQLESLLLRVLDALKQLLHHVTITHNPQDDEVADGIMLDVVPVFAELKNHLQELRDSTSDSLDAASASPPIPKTTSAKTNPNPIQQIFQKKIPEMLREMLQMFKEPDSPSQREKIQNLCQEMEKIGKELELGKWSELVGNCSEAIANKKNELVKVGKIVIKDIEEGREFILRGGGDEIRISPELKELKSMREGEATAEKAEWESLFYIDEKEVRSTSSATIEEDADCNNAGEFKKPEVEMADLNRLADLFEGESLDETWQAEEIIMVDDTENKKTDAVEVFSLEAAKDLHVRDREREMDYRDGAEEADDFMILFDNELPLEEIVEEDEIAKKKTEIKENLAKPIELGKKKLDKAKEKENLFPIASPSTGGVETTSADDFTSWFGDSLEAESSNGDPVGSLDFLFKSAPSLTEKKRKEKAKAEDDWNEWFAEFEDEDSLLRQDGAVAEAGEEILREKDSLPKVNGSSGEWNTVETSIAGDGKEELENDWELSGLLETVESEIDDLNVLTDAEEAGLDTELSNASSDIEWDSIDTMLAEESSAKQEENEWELLELEETVGVSSESDVRENQEETFDFDALNELFEAETESPNDGNNVARKLFLEEKAFAEKWDLNAALSSLGDLSGETATDMEMLFDGEALETTASRSSDSEWDTLDMEMLFDGEALETTASRTSDSEWDTIEQSLGGNISEDILELEALISPEAESSSDALLDITALETLGTTSNSSTTSASEFDSEWNLGEDDNSLGINVDEALEELSSAFNLETSAEKEDDWGDLSTLLSLESKSDDVAKVAENHSQVSEVDEWNFLDDLEASLGENIQNRQESAAAFSAGDVVKIDSGKADEYDELEGLLSQTVSTGASAGTDELDELDELEGLLSQPATVGVANGSDEFDELESLLSQPASTNASADSTDEFDELEGLLSQPATVGVANGIDELDELEGLLTSGTTELVAKNNISPTSAAAVEDGFEDLEKMLQGNNLAGIAVAPGASSQDRSRNRPERKKGEQTMRVPVKQLDNLSNLVGELVVNRNSLEQDQERMRQFLDNLLHQVQQLSDVGSRMQELYERTLLENSLVASRQNYRNLFKADGGQSSNAGDTEYDPLEMDRFTPIHLLSQEMIELIVRVRESTSDIEFLVDETDQVARMLRQITNQLQEGLTRSRMVQFAQTADRLQRVRDNAFKYGKQVELIVEGTETLLDKMILEHLTDPLNHMLNNAIAHGIEMPEVRIAAGKAPVGKIMVQAFHQANQTIITVSDDGAGIDTERVKAKAIEKGLISRSHAPTMSNPEIYDLLFHANFSTKDSADELAGRGVGMDVVRTELNEIRGAITTESTLGKGTTFTIRLPLNLSIGKALCCVSNRAGIAFPMDGVEDMLDVYRDAIQTNEKGERCISWRDSLMPFRPLQELLKYNRQIGRSSVYSGSREDNKTSIVILRSAGNLLAVEVDKAIGEQEIVIKQLQGPVPKPVGIAGATVMGDGQVMPIADILELIDLSRGVIRKVDDKNAKTEEIELKTEPIVLLIDDSITVRKMLSLTFTKAGYRVEQARDGQEAWDKLRSGLPCDVVFCDMEMPRMDGLTLLSKLQQDDNLKHLPVSMLTSRGSKKHQQMAAERGARGYFIKPCMDEILLDAARRMMAGEMLLTSEVAVV